MPTNSRFFIFFLSLIALPAFSQTADFQSAYNALAHFDQPQTQRICKELPVGPKQYFTSLSFVSDILIQDQPAYFEKMAEQENILLEELHALPPTDQFIYQQEIKLHWALLRLKYNHEIAGGWQLYKIFKQQRKFLKQHPHDYRAYKNIGVFEVAFSMIPSKYLWITQTLGIPKGDFSKGISALHLAQKSEFAYESLLLESLVYHFLAHEEQTAISLCPPKDPLHRYFRALMLKKNRQSEEASALFLQDNLQQKLPIIDLHLGDLALRAGEYKAAIGYFNAFNGRKGDAFKADATYKMAMAYLFLKQRKEAESLLKKIKLLPADTYADRYAHAQADLPLPNTHLQQARYFMDGGYWQKARLCLDNIDPNSLATNELQTTYWYRKGQYFELTAQPEKAVGAYLQVIEAQQHSPLYFAPSACLKLGEIYEDRQDYPSAKSFFEQVSDYTGHPYKKSLDQKANAALSQLKEKRKHQ